MDSVIKLLIDWALMAQSRFYHAAVLLKNKVPIEYTLYCNSETIHTGAQSCRAYVQRKKWHWLSLEQMLIET